MATWHALNIESDNESEISIDDTKELQIEDALKLYQSALKHHAAGPEAFEQAAEAYQELFASEIFRYPESQPELQRIELYGPAPDDELSWQLGDAEAGVVVASGSLETGPSTLPQILHLSHKNYAQFKLEYLTARLETLNVTLNQILTDASAALEHFVQALDKDDSDLDLWRKTAMVGSMLNSKRVARFCLEAVLEGDDEGLSGVLSLPGLEEGLAGEQLRSLVAELDDRLSMLQSPLSTGKRRVLSKMLKQRLGVYQGIVEKEKQLVEVEGMPGQSMQQPQRKVLERPSTWAEMGEMLLKQLMAEQHGASMHAPAVALTFDTSSKPQLDAQNIELPPQAMELDVNPTDQPTKFILPTGINEQFPGLDHGNPTAQPQIAPADPSMQFASKPTHDSPTMTLVTRKRSGDTAGLHDSIEEGRSKSKRTRKSNVADPADNRQALLEANIRWEHEQQLNEFQAADDWMFETVGNLFERIGIVGFGKARDVRHEIGGIHGGIDGGNESARDALSNARLAISTFMLGYSDQLAYVLLQKGEDLDIGSGPAAPGLSGSFGSSSQSKTVVKAPPMPDDGIPELLQEVNNDWLLTQDLAYEWLSRLLRPTNAEGATNTYAQYQWPEALKTIVVRTLVNFDESIYERISSDFERLATQMNQAPETDHHTTRSTLSLIEMQQTIFELHLDIYTLIKHPNSGVDADLITTQADRLQRWSDQAREAMHLRSVLQGVTDVHDELNLRFLWAVIFHVAAAADASQDHVIECMNDLRAVFVAAGEPTILLQNNAVMPELSLAALDRELSRLTTKDFFLKVTSQDESDPIAIIESLEPLLNSLYAGNASPVENDDMDIEALLEPANVPAELVRFLQSSAASIRLLLWQRLRNAYSAIDYKPMVVACYFKMMRMLLDESKGLSASELSHHERQVTVLKTLRLLREMVSKVLDITHNCDEAFECLDDTALKTAVSTLGEVLQLVQVFNVFEDSLRVGQSQQPTLPNGLPLPSFAAVTTMIHDFQLHIWILLYRLLQEAIYQNSDQYPTLVEDKFDFLRCVHRNLGLRGICGGGSNRIFVRMLKEEFQHMTHVEGYDSEQAQVLYDLYGLNCFLNPSYELIEHRCTQDAFLDRGVAMQAIDLLLAQASKLPIKELVKHSLKDTIDKVHGVAPRKKLSDAVLRNMEVYRSFLRSPIQPIDLYNCLKGDGNELPISDIPREDALLASKGWYFLMGHISLTKFRSQKRTALTPTEDVDIAIAFFMQDLQCSMDRWETWFRLAQAYDTKIEESVVWSAEKLNNSMPDIVQLQRAAIHCFTMATALMHRSAELAFETSDKMTELHADFAARMYASTREPFSMLPFALDEEKFLSMQTGMGKGKAFQPLRMYTAWKLAKVLYQRAIAGRPRSWTLQYALGKCLWKMHAAPGHILRHDRPPSTQQVLEPFIRAIELLPDKRDSREKREPTLEPHYKLVSIVHKLVTRGELTLEQAEEALRHTSYARIAPYPHEMDEWVPHVLAILKNLRSADKSNWHHRMIARAAHIVYDEDSAGPGGHLGTIGAKHELTQQMFTKTMVLQVWRPECERAGRHFVYTARYTRFFTRILEQLKDRQSLEALARRVRRRPHDMFEHSAVWQDICNAYLRLLRKYADLNEGLETSTFSNIAHEDFLARKEPLEKWMQAQDSGTSAALDVLREVQELKKINQSLMKPGPIDDLIGDAYAYLFNTIGKQLWDEDRRVKLEEEARRPPPPIASPLRNPMMSLNNLMNLDGAVETSAAPSFPPPPATGPTAEQADQPPQRKKIGVGRREIRTCAEGCAQKAAAAPVGRLSTGTRVQVVIDNSRAHHTSGDVSAETSAPASIHDSADDESELSELEEDGDGEGDVEGDDIDIDEGVKREEGQVRRPLFPGLASGMDTAGGSPGSEDLETAEGDDDIEMNEEPEQQGDARALPDRSNGRDNASVGEQA